MSGIGVFPTYRRTARYRGYAFEYDSLIPPSEGQHYYTRGHMPIPDSVYRAVEFSLREARARQVRLHACVACEHDDHERKPCNAWIDDEFRCHCDAYVKPAPLMLLP